MNSVRCSRCGYVVPENTRFCPNCGSPIVAFASQKTNERNKLLYVIIALLLSLLILGLAFILWNGMSNESEDQDSEDTEMWDETSKAEGTTADGKAASSAEKKETVLTQPQPAAKNLVANGSYRLQGAITHKQNYYFNMELNVKNNQVTGRYIVQNGENVYVTLSGTIDPNGNMTLTEYKGGAATGYYFTGRFNQANYSGKYRCTYRKLTMNFNASVY